MRIAYVCYWDVGSATGVGDKIRSQAAEWTRRGHTVAVYALCRGRGRTAAVPAAGGVALHEFAFDGLRGRLAATGALARAAGRFEPAVVYVRYDVFGPALDALAERVPTVVELNTDDLAEYAGRRLPARLANRLARGRLLGRAAGFVCVTEELARSPSFARFRAPTVVVANAGPDGLPDEPLPPAGGPRPRLAFLGLGLPWHGVDKVVALARLAPDWDVDVVGVPPAALGGPAPPNLVAHGELPRGRYLPLLRRADVALGSLALHRIGLEEASPLKVREYLLLGLPTVIAYRDTDFPGQEPPFLLRIANREDNVERELGRIRRFVEEVAGTRVPRAEVEHLTLAAKEERRLAFLAQAAGVAAPRARRSSVRATRG